MPTYEYKCFACGHTFERFQSITAEPIKRCPECGKAKVRRLMGTGAGLIFKGSGFYTTDYRSEGYKEKAKAEAGGGETKPADGGSKSDASATKTEGAAKGEAKAETTSEPKPAAKAPKSESKPSKNK